jgi:transcription elongation factor Elf1
MKCPRCSRENSNCIRIKHSKAYVDVQKCKTCGFLYMTDEEAVKFAEDVSRKLFMKEVLALGKAKTK